jgi:anaerobic magnesium-protoporphyrin IX monomethyl ester cyclase
MVRRAMPDEIGISVSYPLPGTKFYDRVKAEMGVKQNWIESADLAMMFQGAYSTEFYRMLSAFVHKDHRLHQAMDVTRNAFRGRLPARRELRGVALAPYYLAARTWFAWSMKKLQQPGEELSDMRLHVVDETSDALTLALSQRERG